jgi:hypothetical protein
MPMCEIFHRCDFYTIKPFWVGNFGAKIKLVTLTFEGARHNLISDVHADRSHQFLTLISLQASVPYAHDQHVLSNLFKF